MKPSPQFDQEMRRLHAASLESLPPATLARLREARRSAPARRPSRAMGWLAATACTALLAVVMANRLMPADPQPATVPATLAVSTTADAAQDDFVSTTDVLDQNPDLYVWLGSDASLAME